MIRALPSACYLPAKGSRCLPQPVRKKVIGTSLILTTHQNLKTRVYFGLIAGEGQEEVVDSFIQAALSYYGDKGELDNSPLPITLEQDKDSRLSSSPLRYPGKLAADVKGDRLFIADSNNNRYWTDYSLYCQCRVDPRYFEHVRRQGPFRPGHTWWRFGLPCLECMPQILRSFKSGTWCWYMVGAPPCQENPFVFLINRWAVCSNDHLLPTRR